MDHRAYPKVTDLPPYFNRRQKRGVSSEHLYQIYAYLENWDPEKAPGSGPPEGVLLYPITKNPFSHDYRLRGHHVRIRSIDLDQDWRRIHEDLLAVVA